MNTFYEEIEKRIWEAGYPYPVSGEEIYEDICDEIEDKESGSYLFMIKKGDNIYYEYKIDVMEEEFNLAYLIIHTPQKDFYIAFDESSDI